MEDSAVKSPVNYEVELWSAGMTSSGKLAKAIELLGELADELEVEISVDTGTGMFVLETQRLSVDIRLYDMSGLPRE